MSDHSRQDSSTGVDPLNFLGTVDGVPIRLYTLRNRSGMVVQVCNWGARVVSILAPDRDGNLADVALGHGTLPSLMLDTSWVGAFIGRYANRIGRAQFLLDGKQFTISANDGLHCLHGGSSGCSHRAFEVLTESETSLILSVTLADGDDGFPGELTVQLKYALTGDGALSIDWLATTTAPTPASFTSHVYFNLSGKPSSTVHDHQVQIFSGSYLETGEGSIPTGRLCPVDGTSMDFQRPRNLVQSGYDNFWVIAQRAQESLLRPHARVVHPGSGRALEVWSTEPGLQFYDGAHLGRQVASQVDKYGQPFQAHAGMCLEPSQYPDAPNHRNFPDPILRPGHTLAGSIEYRFLCVERDADSPEQVPMLQGASKPKANAP